MSDLATNLSAVSTLSLLSTIAYKKFNSFFCFALLGGGGGFLGGELVQNLMNSGGGGMLSQLAGPLGGLMGRGGDVAAAGANAAVGS